MLSIGYSIQTPTVVESLSDFKSSPLPYKQPFMPLLNVNLPVGPFVLLVCFAIGLLVWVCLPHVVTAAGRGPRRWIEGRPEDLAPDGRDPIYADLYGQLTDLGFRPLGFYHEAIPFGPRFSVATFGSDQGSCLGSLSKLSRYDEPRLRFLSVFHDDAVILTKNDETLSEQRGDFLRQGIATDCAQEVLELHQVAVECYRSTGREYRPCRSLEDRLELENGFYRNAQLVAWSRRNGWGIVRTQLVFLAVMTAPAWLNFGAQSPAPWIVLATTCVAWKALVELTLRMRAHRHGAPNPPRAECVLRTWPRRLVAMFRREGSINSATREQTTGTGFTY